MAVKTGYKITELTTLAERIAAQGAALVADLPREPLWALALTCTCDRCIDPATLPLLKKTAPPDMTDEIILQYFGGVAATNVDQSEASQYEARVIMTHVIAQLGRMIILPHDDAREMSRRLSYIDADYLIPSLLGTGFIPRLPEPIRAEISSYLMDVAQYAIARKTTRLDDALCYLAVLADALPALIETFRTGPPRRHLRLWTSIAGSFVTGDSGGVYRGTDFHLFYSGMPRLDRERLLGALESPDVERLIDRNQE